MKRSNRGKTIYVIAGSILIIILLLISYVRVFDEFEYSTLDFRYRLRPPQQVNDDIVLIEVGDDSIEKLGKWPFPRNYHGLLVKALKSAGAKTIIFDIFFSEKREGDEAFAEAVRDAGNVYIPYVFEPDRSDPDKTRLKASRYAAPLIDILAKEVAGSGFVNVEPDMDGKVRRIPPFIEYEGELYPHMTFLVALHELGYDFKSESVVKGKRINVSEDLVIPLEEDSSIIINYPDVWGKAFKHYSYVDIIQSYLADVTGQEPIIDLEELRDKVCLIGLTATASPDAHPSPMEPLYPGIGVHASLYNSITGKSFIVRVSRWWNLLILLLMCSLTAYVTIKVRKRFALLSIVLIIIVYNVVAMLFFWPLGIWIDVFYPLMAIGGVYIIFTFRKYVMETQKREIIEKELDIAKDIQQSFLPKEIPALGGLDINVKMNTARQVGGDLYDIIELDENRLGFMLGDVSGKGVPAALYMARVVSVFKTFVREGSESEVLKKVNDRLANEASSGLFVTLTYMVLNTKEKGSSYAIGGHMPTLVIEPDGNIELLDVDEGMPLGMIECDFSQADKPYKPGSIFVLYTDGVTEAMDVKQEMFGEDRLVALAKTLKDSSAEEVVNAIHDAVNKFAGKAPQHDDITVMAIRT